MCYPEKGKNYTIGKNHLQCDYVDGHVINRYREPIIFRLFLDKPLGSRIFCQPENLPQKKNKSVLNNLTSHLEGDDQKVLNFNGKTRTLTFQREKHCL